MRKIFLLLIVTMGLLYTQAQTTADKLGAYMAALHNNKNFNGSVLVAKGNEILIEKGYGMRNAATATPHDGNSIFQIGSVTKQFTSVVMLMLQQQGRLSLKDKLSKYFPAYKVGANVTIEQLMQHVSGIYSYTNDNDFMKNHVTENFTQAAFWKMIKDKPLEFAPGSKFSYSNSGYMILGYIIEKVSRQPYEQVVRNMLFARAGMFHSGFDFTHLTSPAKSVGYFELAQNKIMPSPIVDSTVAYAAGAIYSTLRDLYKWNTTLNAGKIIPASLLARAYVPYKDGYGYGFFIDTIYQQQQISHGGGIHGFVSMLAYMPTGKVSVVLLSNQSYDLTPVKNDLLAIMNDKPYDIPDANKEIIVDTAVLNKYIGEYELAPGFIIKIRVVNGGLRAQATGQPEFELFARKENEFFLKVIDAWIEFVKTEEGATSRLILHQGGKDIPGKKIK